MQTEELIKETAKNVFFQKGHLRATTQEIADEAGVNRALIHYYFRSRNQLFDTVLQETMSELMGRIIGVFKSEATFKQKICSFIDLFITSQYPYLQTFIVTEMVKDPEKMKLFHPKDLDEVLTSFRKQLAVEVRKGTIAPVSMEQLIVNIMSLGSYPYLAKPIIQTVFILDDQAYENFLKERKNLIYRSIFNEDIQEE
ncbi:TetR/AcrR family transcriptional regulator [Pontibacter silvestris]|uniref:TetR/AcrR family transcriptional regulator n=1 Tax=Pontibacter silvestris TaxID=2305183 RepID=A0ABW4X0S0_9BACT|nr:TetR/AcrR family transcriptional regulator [Pontibacter silvestris]MCC9138453.1 TetR/AcrR family transcriptional regulator [Pontibacter silvestris]